MKNISKQIEKEIGKIKEGITFKYENLSINSEEYSAAAKVMERLIKKGLIKRASTGLFYKAKITVFGELRPNEEELIKPYLFKEGKRVAYITGMSLYNRKGLTTQIPKTIAVASMDKRIRPRIGIIKVKSVKSYVDVTDNNFNLLEILDVLKDYKEIPDLDVESGIKILQSKILKIPNSELKKMVKYALKYPPRVRAFLGALFTAVNINEGVNKLKLSLNPLTSYNIGISSNQLSSAPNWKIS